MMKVRKFASLSYQYLCICYILFLSFTVPVKATEKEQDDQKRPSSTPSFCIVSPEGVEVMKGLKVISSFHPKIAQPDPQIHSLDEFKVAKEYFFLSKRYNKLMQGAALGSARMEFIEQSQGVLKGLKIYIDTLRSSTCDLFRSPEDEKIFQEALYEVHYLEGQNYLTLLTRAVLVSLDPQQYLKVAKKYIEEIKKVKKEISASPKYRKLLQEQIQTAQEMVPLLKTLFYSEENLPSPSFSRSRLNKIEIQRTVNQYQKICNSASEGIEKIDIKESFDLHFHIKAQKMFTEMLTLFTQRKITSEVYSRQMQNLAEDFRALEKEGVRFRDKVSKLNLSSELSTLGTENLTNLYRFLCQRNPMPHKNPLQFLEEGIFLLMQTNQLEEALLHTEALGTLLLEQGPLSKNFISLRASVMALNGNFEEWRKILQNKKNTTAQKKITAQQNTVNHIKQHLKQNEMKQEKLEPSKPPQLPQVIKKVEKSTVFEDSPEFGYQSPIENYKSEIIIPREKIKTHNPPYEPSPKDVDHKFNNQSLDTPVTIPAQNQKVYFVSKNAFKIYKKIRAGDTKFSRNDLYNLFDKLGCKIDIKQGKGDHNKILPPLKMTITNPEGYLAVLPEFTQKKWKQDNTPLPLTVPNWDEKWDGRAPPYMMKSIVQALDYLGATDKTVQRSSPSD